MAKIKEVEIPVFSQGGKPSNSSVGQTKELLTRGKRKLVDPFMGDAPKTEEDDNGMFAKLVANFDGAGQREFDYPTLAGHFMGKGLSQGIAERIASEKSGDAAKRMNVMTSYSTSFDPRAIADVAKAQLGAEIEHDKFGNPVVVYEGKKFYVNRPGADWLDLTQFGMQILPYAKAAKFASALSAGAGALKNVMAQFMANAGTSVGLDAANEVLGSNQGVDWQAALFAGAGGAGTELLTPLVLKTWRAIVRSPVHFDAATGKLTATGKRIAKEAGLDPDEFQGRAAEIFAKEYAATKQPQYAADAARGAEFDIPLTRGQRTGSIPQQRLEQEMEMGRRGADAQSVMQNFQGQQRGAMAGAADDVQARLAQGAPSGPTEADAAARVQAGLVSKVRTLEQQIDDAYDMARQHQAFFTGENIDDLMRNANDKLASYDLDPQLFPATYRSWELIENFNQRVQASGARRGGLPRPLGTGEAPSPAEFREFEILRRKINNNIGAAKTSSDRAATIKVKGALDEWMDEAVDKALFSGDDQVLEAVKNARALRAEKTVKFASKSGASQVEVATGKAIQKMIAEEATAEQVANYMIGKSRLGSKNESVQIAQRLRTILGENSQEWTSVKELLWMRLTKAARPDSGTFNPLKYRVELDRTMTDARSLMNEVFTPEEIALMRRFEREVARTVKPEQLKAPFPVRTTWDMVRGMLRRVSTVLTFRGLPEVAWGPRAMIEAPAILGGRAAGRAVSPLKRPRPSSGASPGLAAEAAGQQERQR